MADTAPAPARIPFLSTDGGPDAVGQAHGGRFAERIGRAVELYGTFFARPEAEVFEAARHFRSVIGDYNPDYVTEMAAIADAAKIDPLWIVALNARSELLSAMAPECTAIHFSGSPVMGQNWDWEERLEDLIVLMQIRRADGHRLLMMTEPGIIGKIGLNNAGVGVCFNFLPSTEKTLGLPVHILLRSLLDAPSWDDAVARLKGAGNGRSCNILIGHRGGENLDMEFTGAEGCEVPAFGSYAMHTNHYVACDMAVPESFIESSVPRYELAQSLAGARDADTMAVLKHILSTRNAPDERLLVPYEQRPLLGRIGTVCTIAMDLEAGVLSIRKGNDPAGSFTDYSIH